jgi:hypothetical protein
MGVDDQDVLLAVALGASSSERRLLPDRRTGIDRRKGGAPPPAGSERRSGTDRRRGPRRQGETTTGLLQRALGSGGNRPGER